MDETYLSFYLRVSRIHLFIEALRGIGNPDCITFLTDKQMKHLFLVPYHKKTFHSISVPKAVYSGGKYIEPSSRTICGIVAGYYHWDRNYSYRVPGKIFPEQQYVLFDLTAAEKF